MPALAAVILLGGFALHSAVKNLLVSQFAPEGTPPPHPNHLRFLLGKDDGIFLEVQAKAPGDELVTRPVNLMVRHEDVFGARAEAYQRLLEDATEGERTLVRGVDRR